MFVNCQKVKTFSFYVPLISLKTKIINKTVLIVDDEVDFCHIIGSILVNQGFKTLIAHSLESAQNYLTDLNPTIILLDHNLPDGLGTEFLEKNKEALEDKHVIFITADTSPEVKEKAMGYGVFDFLPKPFHASVLNKVIHLAATFN